MTEADSDDTPPAGEGKDVADLRIETKRVLFEVQLTLESVAAGLESIARLPEAKPIVEQLGVLQKLTSQARRGDRGLRRHIAERAGELISPPNWRRRSVASFRKGATQWVRWIR
jgi:hypothetical protein